MGAFAPCGLLLVAAAQAQTSADSVHAPVSLEEVVVTATKRAETLIDVPVAVTAITMDQLQARGFNDYADYLNTIPNVWMQDIGPGQTQLYIRGLVAQGGSGFPVATYFGEAVTSVVTNNGGFADLRLVDIERVEVLRGPQGTLFGANSLAGVLRIVPAAPNLAQVQLNSDIRGWATAHSDGFSGHAEGVFNLPIVTDQLGVRLVAYKDHIAGYIDNVVPATNPVDYSASLGAPYGTLLIPGHAAFTRKDINSEDVWGARLGVTWKPTDTLRLDLNYTQQGVRLNSEPPVQQTFGDYNVQRPLDQFERGKSSEDERIGTFVVNYDWARGTLTSATSYTDMRRFASQDISWLAVSVGLGAQLWALQDRSKGTEFTQEIRVQSRGSAPLQWLAGYFYSNSQNNLGQNVPDYSCPTCLPEVLAGQNFALRTAGTPINAKQKQNSVFGDVSYDVSPHWTIGGGGRYLKDYIEAFALPGDGILGGGPATATGPNGGGVTSIFNPSAYIRFKPNSDIMYYLQAARGFRSGTANQSLSFDPNGPCAASAAELGVGPLSAPDKLWTYEAGLKSRWLDNRMATNLAVFHQKWDGVQLGTSQACGFQAVVNGGDASGNGAELEVNTQIAPALSANLSASWVHNKFDRVVPGLGYSDGDRVPGAPEENLSAGLQYDFELNSRWKGYARGDYVYVGNVHYQFGQGGGSESFVQGGYGQGNVRLALRRDTLSIELFGRNITDRRAAEATGDPASGGYTYLIRPREVGLELRYSFERPR
jgi:iron complex outermembrane recepter protein